jgi:hypothetical protein
MFEPVLNYTALCCVCQTCTEHNMYEGQKKKKKDKRTCDACFRLSVIDPRSLRQWEKHVCWVVTAGRETGVFTDATRVHRAVAGYPNCEVKGFESFTRNNRSKCARV